MACNHSGPHSGASHYLREAAQVRLAVLCDRCGAERADLGTIDYRPNARRLVGHLAELTARELALDERQIARVRLAALVCDVGRNQIPPEILNKRGPLSDEEWRQIRRQPELGAALLSDTSFDDIRAWVLCHRERPDGRGYPRGLKLEQIPVEARILAVVDAYVAMTNDRPHRVARAVNEAKQELLRYAGTQFDRAVVESFLRASSHSRPRLAA
jgi:HD-GYP domain-containing protein (c-di-GMP phosphodiesterase class II)